jgi:MYND finger
MVNDPKLGSAVRSVPSFPIITTTEETLAFWKKMVPAMVERCRTWSHTPNCAYQASGIPRSTGLRDDPICECGRGKDLGPFTETKDWKPLAPYVTRIAIGLLFPSNFESIWLLNATSRLLESKSSGREFSSRSIDAGIPHEELLKGREEEQREGCLKCKGLGGDLGLLKCSRCKEARYCSDKCQRADWKNHKPHCSSKKS